MGSSFNRKNTAYICCRDCTKRSIGCHSNCKDYISATIKAKEQQEIERANMVPHINKNSFLGSQRIKVEELGQYHGKYK